jgi:sigma-E factor negative regulatory protein RseC
MSNNTIRHPGEVLRITPEAVEVKILRATACSSCVSKGACSIGDAEEKTVTVENYEGEPLKQGDKVMLMMHRSSGNKALFYGYFLPFLVLVTVLVSGSVLVHDEGALALISIGSLIPYYMALYHFRDRLKKKFTVTIE